MMNSKVYVNNMPNSNYCNIPQRKETAEIITRFLIYHKLIYFGEGIPFAVFNTHYERIPEAMMSSVVRSLIAPDDRVAVNSNSIKEAIERASDMPELQLDLDLNYEKNKDKINLLNGIYDVRAQTRDPHDIKRQFIYRLNFKYLPEPNRKLETFDRFIETSIGNENRECLLRIIGAAFSSRRDFKKAVILLGPQNSGKSLILNLIEQATGEQYVTCKPFDKLGTEQAIAAFEIDKRVNLSRDIRLGVIRNDGNFKSVISCEKTDGRQLYKNATPMVPKVFCIAAANAYPRFKNADEACINRILPIRIKGYDGEPDYDLASKLDAEKDSICSLAIDHLKEFIESNYDFCESEDSKLITKQQLYKLNAHISFIKENYKVGTDGEIPSTKLYNEYLSWCESNALDKIGKTTFYEQIKSEFSSITYCKVRYDGKYVCGFKGLTPKEFDEFIVGRR